MPPKKRTYQENFIAGVKLWMAQKKIGNLKKAAPKLEMGYMALFKIMDGTNNPTVDVCIKLCKEAGYSANWLLLNEGEILLKDQENMSKIFSEIKNIKRRLKIEGKPLQ